MSMSIVSVGGGCLALATDNGRAFLLGRHVLNNEQRQTMAPAQLPSPPLQATAPLPVPGLENVQVQNVQNGPHSSQNQNTD